MNKIITFGAVGAGACLIAGLFGLVLFPSQPSDFLNRVSPALFSALLAVSLSFALVIVQNLYLRRPLLSLNQGMIVLAGSAGAGLLSGAVGSGIFALLKMAFGSLGDLDRFLGWIILGGLLGLGLAFFIPNLPKIRAALAGAFGGFIGAWAFVDLARALNDTSGRVAGAAILGLCIGLMIAVVEAVFLEAWLEVVFGPKETRRVGLGRDPITIGSASHCTVYARNAPPVAFRFRLEQGKVQCEDVATGRVEDLGPGDTRMLGKLSLVIGGASVPTPAAGIGAGPGPTLVTDFFLKLPSGLSVPLTDGKVVGSADLPGLDAAGSAPAAEVTRNPQDPSIRGLKNLMGRPWSATLKTGEYRKVDPGRNIQLAAGTKIDFGGTTGLIDASTSAQAAGTGAKARYLAGFAIAFLVLIGLAIADGFRRQSSAIVGPPPTTPEGQTLRVVIHDARSSKHKEQPEPKKLRLAVTSGQFDDVGSLLKKLGDGYKFTPIELRDLEEADKIAHYDVIFATCSELKDYWKPLEEKGGAVKESLRRFVGKGGTLYASDLQLSLVRHCFPEFAGSPFPAAGAQQNLIATVMDSGLKDVIGQNLPLTFDQAGWFPAGFDESKATILVNGTYLTDKTKREVAAPLLVKLNFEKGTIFFTSFHIGKGNSDRELDLLRYLVFAAVTSEDAAKMKNTLVESGFTPTRENIFTTSSKAQSETKVHTTRKAGQLLFGLSFRGEGVKLRLTVESPAGKTASHEDTLPFTIEVPEAPAGDWKYTVTAIQLPNPNFPFTVTLGEK